MVDVLFIHIKSTSYKYGTLKPIKVTLERGMNRRKNNGGDNQFGLLQCVYMEMSQ
jgi:hypothetical protein